MGGWQPALEEHSDVFDEIARNRQALWDAEGRELVLIAQACVDYEVDPAGCGQACEKLIAGGADGTPIVGEFLALELGALLGISPREAALEIADVLNLRYRHPLLWAKAADGQIRAWQALKVVAQCATAGLGLPACLWVDRQLAPAVGLVPFGRLMKTVAGLVVQADPALAVERAERQHAARSVSVGEHADGGSVVYARLDTPDAISLDRTIDRLADVLAATGDTEAREQRRATALGLLADPAAAAALLGDPVGERVEAPRPRRRRAELMIHLAADTLYPDVDGRLHPAPWNGPPPAEPVEAPASPMTLRQAQGSAGAGTAAFPRPGMTWTDWHRTHVPAVARVEGVGPVDVATLRRWLGDAQVVVRPVVDLNIIPAVDAYEVPVRLRQILCARNPVEVFPYSNRSSSGAFVDLDHTIPFDHQAGPGALQTRIENLGPLARRPHNAKTSNAWTVTQPEPGSYVFTSKYGYRYHVDERTRHHRAGPPA